jgi:cytochrome b
MTTGASQEGRAGQRMVMVWDIGVRLFHWGVVAGVLAAYLSEDSRSLHRAFGYVVMGLIAFRLI